MNYRDLEIAASTVCRLLSHEAPNIENKTLEKDIQEALHEAIFKDFETIVNDLRSSCPNFGFNNTFTASEIVTQIIEVINKRIEKYNSDVGHYFYLYLDNHLMVTEDNMSQILQDQSKLDPRVSGPYIASIRAFRDSMVKLKGPRSNSYITDFLLNEADSKKHICLILDIDIMIKGIPIAKINSEDIL